jgi:hypothetical protein
LAASIGLLVIGLAGLPGRLEDSPSSVPGGGQPTGMRDNTAQGTRRPILKERLELEVEERIGPDGKPVRQPAPASYRIEVYER